MRNVRLACLVSSIALLTACGGGGDDSTAAGGGAGGASTSTGGSSSAGASGKGGGAGGAKGGAGGAASGAGGSTAGASGKGAAGTATGGTSGAAGSGGSSAGAAGAGGGAAGKAGAAAGTAGAGGTMGGGTAGASGGGKAGASGGGTAGAGGGGTAGAGGSAGGAGSGGAAGAGGSGALACPTASLYTTPYPDPQNVGQLSTTFAGAKTVSGIDASAWAPVGATAYGFRWTITGGDCDDILPHPTFALFPAAKSDWATHLGTQVNGLAAEPAPGQPDPAKPAGTRKGYVVQGGGTPAKVFPAFALSGAYHVTAKFKYVDPKTSLEVDAQCTQIVEVGSPGIRAELCWPEVGPSQDDNDVDLHVARLQGNAAGKHGWFTTAGVAPSSDDCYYSPNSACSNRTKAALTPGWYVNELTPEPGNVGVCHGWGSRRFDGSVPGTVARPCTSPRQDRENITCNPTIDDPNAPETDPAYQGAVSDVFCGAENINIDAPVLTPGDRFAVGVACYGCVAGNNGAANAQPAHPHVNVYCDGKLAASAGYDPAVPMSTAQFPQLWTEGQSLDGSMWQVGIIDWTGTPGAACQLTKTTADPAKWNKDSWHQKSNGSADVCVNNGPLDIGGGNFAPPQPSSVDWKFKADGSYPTAADELCAN